jgi:hypothetical protein
MMTLLRIAYRVSRIFRRSQKRTNSTGVYIFNIQPEQLFTKGVALQIIAECVGAGVVMSYAQGAVIGLELDIAFESGEFTVKISEAFQRVHAVRPKPVRSFEAIKQVMGKTGILQQPAVVHDGPASMFRMSRC